MLASVVACASLLVSPAVVPRAPVARVASPVMAAAADDFVPDMQRRTIMNLPKKLEIGKSQISCNSFWRCGGRWR